MTVTSLDQLDASVVIDAQQLERVVERFPMRISAHIMALIREGSAALARQVIPDMAELDDAQANADPLNEEAQSPAPQVIHRYPGRVLFLVSNQCAVYCRFCMRKRRVGNEERITREKLSAGLDYIRNHTGINEVILSGGDPLMLDDDTLLGILEALRKMPHVSVLRIHTRIPVAWPQRITPELADRLSGFHPLYVNIHFNHPDEIAPLTVGACTRLADAGIPLGSQTVLLRNVNDRRETLHRLFQQLLAIRVRPYYLHQLDHVPGSRHFQVPIQRALKIVHGLRGRISGQAMPHFMVDLPGGGGKVELLGDSVEEKTSTHWMIRNFQGEIFRYPITI